MLPAAPLTANDTADGIHSAGWLSTMRSRPEFCGKDSHETPCSIVGECLCCFTPERLLLARYVDAVWWLPERLRDRWMCPRNGPNRLPPGWWNHSDRLPRSDSGTGCLLALHEYASRLPAAVAANHRDGFAANLPLRFDDQRISRISEYDAALLISDFRQAAGRYVISCRLFCCAVSSGRRLGSRERNFPVGPELLFRTDYSQPDALARDRAEVPR
jgi:hypothetical protein